jgi:hypothetical protein
MPQVPKSPGGFTGAQQSASAPLALELSEVDDFLSFLFSNPAIRPDNLQLQEGAAVARYLKLLALHGVPLAVLEGGQEAIDEYHRIGQRREEGAKALDVGPQLVKAADAIWWHLQAYGEFEPSSKGAALGFIKRHLGTYFGKLKPVLSILENYGIPQGVRCATGPPSFMSPNLNVAGPGNPHLRDDLSERIFAAYHALPLAGMKRRSPKIAAALNSAHAAGRDNWIWSDVYERIKGYKRGLRLRLRKHGMAAYTLPAELKGEEGRQASLWIGMFRFDRMVRQRFGGRIAGDR